MQMQVPDRILNEEIEAQIEYVFERCKSRVKIVGIIDTSDTTFDLSANVSMRSFLDEFAAASDKVEVVIHEKGENHDLEMQIGAFAYPVIALFKTDDGSLSYHYSGVSFYGVPGGHELEAFILSIYNVAGPGQPIGEDVKSRIVKLETPLNLKMCISLTCQMCSELVQAGNRIATLNPGITVDTIDLATFENVQDEFNIISVPATIINGKEIVYGRKSLKEMLAFLEERENISFR